MERVKTIFKCIGLRVVPGGIEAKFAHADDLVIVRVNEDTKVALGHEYQMSMKAVDAADAAKTLA